MWYREADRAVMFGLGVKEEEYHSHFQPDSSGECRQINPQPARWVMVYREDTALRRNFRIQLSLGFLRNGFGLSSIFLIV